MTEKETTKAALGDNKEESSFVIDNDFEQIVQELVPRTDDPSVPSFTFRVVLLGLIFNFALAFINTLFSFRGNPFGITSYIAIMLAFPMGKFLAKVVPAGNIFGLELNPGPFSIKEHALI
ncbi:OPT oligopeptide transporter protein-domain-containing protein, partial [Blastocladiella britannica]